MERRENAGYVIVEALHIGKAEFVIGENPVCHMAVQGRQQLLLGALPDDPRKRRGGSAEARGNGIAAAAAKPQTGKQG